MGTHSRTPRHGRVADAEDSFLHEHNHTRVPRLVQWMVTLRCPMHCPHCLADGKTGDELDLAEAAALIEQVADMGVDEFLLTGGEPLARDDLPEIIGVLRANHVRWSLNTAAMPGPRIRRAIETWPPSFVAVSLDGPPSVHDHFRGREGAFDDALASLAFFSDIAADGVAAGTTVTQRNFHSLPQTFGIVLESAATAWGLHLVVPEGRAASRPDLFLSRKQLKRLLRFAAAKRQYIPVDIADEIGYCGLWEPLVRDQPFFCGAGRAQCVVLPDGEVVPCTTVDRSASAGSIRREPLQCIWDEGFGDLRSWAPEGRCVHCRYARACEGGCWLQRRHGTQCFRDIWHVPRAVATAGMAIVLGLSAPEMPTAMGATPQERPKSDVTGMELLQRSIIQWYAADTGLGRTPRVEYIKANLSKSLPDDPGAKYFLGFIKGDRPASIAGRAQQIQAALGTSQRSLCLIGVAWRDVTEWCLDHTPPAARSPEQRKTLRRVLTRLAEVGHAWRVQVFEKKLDPFLRRPPAYRRFFITKAGPPPHLRFEKDLAVKRGWTDPDLARALVKEHYFGEIMTLRFRVPDGAAVRCLRDGRSVAVDGSMRVFDILLTPGGKEVVVTFQAPGGEITITLPAGAEVTYGDVLRLAADQCFADPAKRRLAGSGRYTAGVQGHAFALSLLRQRVRELEAKGQTARTSGALQGAKWHLADLYLF